MKDDINSMTDEEYKMFVNYHLSICEREDLIGYSCHILSIIEKTESVIDKDEAERTAKNFQKGKFDLEDFLSTMKQIKKMGPLENLLKLLPGASKMGLNNVTVDPKLLGRIEAIVLSMTPYERQHPEVLKATRKIRIAKGSGTTVEDVNRLLKQFESMQTMMKQMKNGNLKMPF